MFNKYPDIITFGIIKNFMLSNFLKLELLFCFAEKWICVDGI